MLKSQDGYVLIVVMLFLLVLTIIGISATNTAYIELNIAKNTNSYNKNFYLAEGAIKEIANENLASNWVKMNKDNNLNLNEIITQNSQLGSNVFYGAVNNGIPQGVKGSGNSLKIQDTNAYNRMYFFDLYGKSVLNNNTIIIVTGYKKRL